MMKKVVINNCYGGFSLSHAGIMEYARRKGMQLFLYQQEPFLKGPWKKVVGDPGDSLFRGFYFTQEFEGEYLEENYFSDRDIARDDPILVEVVEALGSDADGSCAELKVIEIPDDVNWVVEEYDGTEWIAEKHRTWR